MTWTTLLSGVVGSHAYGLAHEESDVDRLEFAAAHTSAFHGLRPLTDKTSSIVYADPDITVHEIGKAIRLLLKCNPTVTELLWLDDYEVMSSLGATLISLRSSFLSAPYVATAYLGYAVAQFRKLTAEHAAGGDAIENRRHREKNARHLMRLVEQGMRLYTTGELTVRVDDPERLFAFGRRAVDDPSIALPLLNDARNIVECSPTPLPAVPDTDAAETYLHVVRRHFFLVKPEDD